MLTKNAPAGLVLKQSILFLRATASYALRDVIRPVLRLRRPRTIVVRRRLVSFGGFLRLLPVMLGSRRELRSAALVSDRQLEPWFVAR
jgi:hypothetical protein